MRVVWLASCALLFGGACGDSFAPVYWLREPRLIAVTADPPELPRLATTTLTAVVADPSDTVAATFRWWRCDRAAIAGVDGDVSADCMRDDTNVDYLVPLGSGARIEAVMPDVDPATLGVPDYTLGLYVPIRVDMQVGERVDKIVYRLRLQDTASSRPANHNPVFAGLFQSRSEAGADAGTDDVDALPSEEPLATIGVDGTLRLRARFAEGSGEAMTVIAVDGSGTPSQAIANESLRVSWFTSYGDLSSAATGDDLDTELSFADEKRRPTPLPPEGVVVDLWAVGRDERGGTTVTRGRVRVVP